MVRKETITKLHYAVPGRFHRAVVNTTRIKRKIALGIDMKREAEDEQRAIILANCVLRLVEAYTSVLEEAINNDQVSATSPVARPTVELSKLPQLAFGNARADDSRLRPRINALLKKSDVCVIGSNPVYVGPPANLVVSSVTWTISPLDAQGDSSSDSE